MTTHPVPGPLLSVRDVTVTYGASTRPVPAVRGVSFDLAAGESLGLAGESGCGKTTLASAVLRLLPADAALGGEVLLDGQDVLTMKPGQLRAVRWTKAAVVFQGALHALNPVQDIGTQIAEPILLHSTEPSAKAARKRVGDLLEQVGLAAGRADDYPHELSGGPRQRVLIAMALACEPLLLVADEPTTALDLMVQAQVLALLSGLRAERGLAMLFITHDLSVLTSVCDRLAVMYAGRIVEEGASEEVFFHPRHPYTTALGAAFPTIGDQSYRMRPSGLAGDPPDPTDLPAGCTFNPRCPLVEDRCHRIDPDLYPAGDGRRAACVLVGDHLVGGP
ncbi:MAG: ABC transporter ATP-binding protein [Acidimicrobiia bacterium]